MERMNSQQGIHSSKQYGYKRSDSTASKKGFFSHTNTFGQNDMASRLNYRSRRTRS